MVDAGSANKGFKPASGLTGDHYLYNLNGNMTQDNHKSFAFGYNFLNLPQTMTKVANVITMNYTADGEKLTKAITGGATKNYVSGIEYSGANLEAIYFSEGRCTPNGATAFFYEYTIKDHLGNARASFRAITNGTAIQPLQENHYYPFGMEMEGSWMTQVGTENQYEYNGKELNEDFGLNLYDYGARWYDAAVGRWWSVDPIAKYASSYSPYSYVQNDPVNFIDPNGGFKIPASFRNDYPNLVRYIETQLRSHIEKSEAISGVLYYFSGGNLDLNQIADDFKPDSGPIIDIDKNDFADGQYDHYSVSIFFKKERLSKIEKILKTGNPQAQQIALIDFMQTFVNEYVHYGDAIDGYDLIFLNKPPFVTNDLSINGKEQSVPNRFEEGNEAARILYPIDTPYRNFILFSSGKYFEGDNTGEGKKEMDKSKIPDPPKA